MKIKVHRQLSGGLYHVGFTVSDFTPEEVAKMGSFGTPLIRILHGPPNGRKAFKVVVTQIGTNYKPSFDTEQEAKTYEAEVVAEIREAMKAIRERKDDFSGTQEVDV